jgi:hypothetical protein
LNDSPSRLPDASAEGRSCWDRRGPLYLQYVSSGGRPTSKRHRCRFQRRPISNGSTDSAEVSVDTTRPQSSTVEGRKGDFLDLDIGESSTRLCLQVLEHVPDVAAFARKLLRTTPHLIVSVPYRWEPGEADHIHDPVDEVKLASWFGRKPNYRLVVREPFFKKRRMIAYFDRENPARRITKAEVHLRRPSPLITRPPG